MTAKYIEPEKVAEWLKDPSLKNGVDYQIVDVRGDDFEGGHIRGAKNIPAHEIVDNTEAYLEELAKPKKLVFHCALSQVRGPKSANTYLRTLQEKGAELNQEVLVLQGGFTTWQYRYKDDKDLVEGYKPELWRD
ncbi:hypothetical protein HDU96_010301 [Phlyctochytrium bullatum]|nr:hypothetical protein HDU96_010301 [Phlyctochytrium bullatum]